MDELKLTKEHKEHLLSAIADILMDDVFTAEDAVELIDFMLEKCRYKQAALSESLLEERFRLQ